MIAESAAEVSRCITFSYIIATLSQLSHNLKLCNPRLHFLFTLRVLDLSMIMLGWC